MPRNTETTAPSNQFLNTIYLADTGLAGQTEKFKFTDLNNSLQETINFYMS